MREAAVAIEKKAVERAIRPAWRPRRRARRRRFLAGVEGLRRDRRVTALDPLGLERRAPRDSRGRP